jgi:hypothetical protein
MAAQDEYIHSDTLNTPGVKRGPTHSKSSMVVAPTSRREREEGSSETGIDAEQSEHSGGSSWSSSWSLLDRPRHVATPKNEENAAATASRQSRPWPSKDMSEPGSTSSIHSLPDTYSHSPPQHKQCPCWLIVIHFKKFGGREKQTEWANPRVEWCKRSKDDSSFQR